MMQLFEKQKRYFQTGETRSIDFRLQQLKNLKAAIKKYEREIIDTLKVELHKSEFEAFSTEIGVIYEEIRFIAKRLPHWMKPQRVATPLTHIGSKSYIYPEPYGVNLT
jgi:aldehyde dehydrogenase (NAD+)